MREVTAGFNGDLTRAASPARSRASRRSLTQATPLLAVEPPAAGQPTNLVSTFGDGYLYDMAENANSFQAVYAGGDAEAVLSASDVSRSSTRDEAS